MTMIAHTPDTFPPPAPVAGRPCPRQPSLINSLEDAGAVATAGRGIRSQVARSGSHRCLCHRPRPPRLLADVLVGVEAKLASWQRALRHAVLNRFSVDLSMIALPAYKVTDAVIAACWDQGVGVLAVDQKWLHVVVPATGRAGRGAAPEDT